MTHRTSVFTGAPLFLFHRRVHTQVSAGQEQDEGPRQRVVHRNSFALLGWKVTSVLETRAKATGDGFSRGTMLVHDVRGENRLLPGDDGVHREPRPNQVLPFLPYFLRIACLTSERSNAGDKRNAGLFPPLGEEKSGDLGIFQSVSLTRLVTWLLEKLPDACEIKFRVSGVLLFRRLFFGFAN